MAAQSRRELDGEVGRGNENGLKSVMVMID